eukprot:RCo017527
MSFIIHGILLLLLFLTPTAARSSHCCAIMYTIHPAEVDNLIQSLNRTFTFFNWRPLYPTLLFYDAKLLGQLDLVQGKLKSILKPDWLETLRWIEVNWKPPTDIKKEDVYEPVRHWFPDYSLMIKFWFSDVLHLNATKRFSYYLRLDTDSMVHSEFPVDPFQLMIRKGYAYGYYTLYTDEAFVTVGLIDFVESFVNDFNGRSKAALNKLQLPPLEARKDYGPPMMYTNFELLNMRRFRRDPLLKEFERRVLESKRIHTNRWGDSPLRYYQVMTGLDWNKEVLHFCNFSYAHLHHNFFRQSCGH